MVDDLGEGMAAEAEALPIERKVGVALDLDQPAIANVEEDTTTIVAARAGSGDTPDDSGIGLLPGP
jgi:hypothetical protein